MILRDKNCACLLGENLKRASTTPAKIQDMVTGDNSGAMNVVQAQGGTHCYFSLFICAFIHSSHGTFNFVQTYCQFHFILCCMATVLTYIHVPKFVHVTHYAVAHIIDVTWGIP